MRTIYYALPFLLLSAAPVAAQVPVNDACSGAIPITCGQSVVGNTSTATADPQAFTCFTSIQANGIWYSFAGTGEAITLSTCANFAYDTRINVYSGSCNALVCVAGNDDGGGCDVGSTLGFPSVLGTTYLILVQGYQGGVGEFEMTVACAPVTSDYCAGAVPITCNQSIDGSTLLATFDSAPTCETSIQAPGVWFTFTGISDPVELSTCESFDYDTRLNVYRGSCTGLICVAGNDDTEGVGFCSTVYINPDPAITYYVLVQGYDGAVGDFMLGLTCQTCGTPTGIFTSATDASAFVYWETPNIGATYTIEYGPLGFAPGTGELVTGTVTGPTPVAEITGLDADTDYAFYLQEQCTPEESSAIVGAFAFTTLPEPPPANAVCSGALPIACGAAVDGNTALSFFSPGPTCGAANITSAGLWYTFTGTGETVTLSTCGTADFDTKISVYTGLCTDPLCIAGGDDAVGCADNSTQVEFATTDGSTYSVLVHGYQDQVGTFTLSMSCTAGCTPVAANDDCANAIALTPSGTGLCNPLTGTNECSFAPGVANPPCDPFGSIVDVWYSFNTGDHTSFTVLLEALSIDGLNAAVYADCGSLTYVDCETGIDADWQLDDLEPQTDHYLRIWNGGATDAGTFSVCIETDLSTAVPTSAVTNGVRLWPNPASNRITMEGVTSKTIAVIDLQGRVVLSAAANNATVMNLDISNIAPGSYVLRSMDADGRMLGRFIKE